MKTLFIGYGPMQSRDDEIKISTFTDTSPFGFNTIVVDTQNIDQMLGNGPLLENWVRWNRYLEKWFAPQNRLIVILRPQETDQGVSNYRWLPIPFEPANLITAGSNDFLGNVTSADPIIKNFLEDEGSMFTAVTHYRLKGDEENIFINSQIDSELVTSFTYRHKGTEVIFLPLAPRATYEAIIKSLQSVSNNWETEDIKSEKQKLQVIEGQLAELKLKKQEQETSLANLNNEVSKMIKANVYLSRSIKKYEAVTSKENPNPELFYEAIENIENHFSSEKAMRDALGVTKAFIDKVMRRTNEFRHAQKTGEDPVPLTDEEITDFRNKLSDVIHKFIEYLLAEERSAPKPAA